jgi:hypothetical protein
MPAGRILGTDTKRIDDIREAMSFLLFLAKAGVPKIRKIQLPKELVKELVAAAKDEPEIEKLLMGT